MKRNINGLDRIARIIFAVVAAILYITGITSGMLGMILIVAGGILLLTAVINFCPIYYALGISTHKKKE